MVPHPLCPTVRAGYISLLFPSLTATFYADSPHTTGSSSNAIVHLNNTTLQQIDQFVQDVEMQVAMLLLDHAASAN
jgi:hypothetical protein